ncbi:E3 SUMO-protein ligase Mms21p [[Candida] jaroonii]|uniref:E3 SUMO-protein ligase Mms21p n=1 Tax=[Candida] jaroonii TaxID=467808 RepID=A0ACA9Y3Z5_9ASCO|nr:E3 SUMO-protein ligase Mms21p [[Candida] jaroonii]
MEVDDTPDMLDISVPRYLPMSQETLKTFSAMVSAREDNLGRIDSILRSIKQDIDKYVEFIIGENMFENIGYTRDFMIVNLQSLERILISKYELENWKAIAFEIRNNLNQQIPEDPATLSNLQQYHDANDETLNEFIRRRVDEMKNSPEKDKNIREYVNKNDLYQLLKNMAFVIEKPTDPLPEEQDDDDVAMAGGVISLKDPMSLHTFKEPVKSKKCDHVFEKSVIEEYLRNEIKTCPVAGCEGRLAKFDLRSDDLMLLRVKVFEAKQQADDFEIETI